MSRTQDESEHYRPSAPMTNQDKLKIVAKLISNPKGRIKLIKISKEANALDKLGEAIVKCFDNFK